MSFVTMMPSPMEWAHCSITRVGQIFASTTGRRTVKSRNIKGQDSFFSKSRPNGDWMSERRSRSRTMPIGIARASTTGMKLHSG